MLVSNKKTSCIIACTGMSSKNVWKGKILYFYIYKYGLLFLQEATREKGTGPPGTFLLMMY